jgi:hypothetical protein
VSPGQLVLVLRLPKGDECACVPCGLIFADEEAFGRHITRRGHVEPTTVGLVEKVVAGGPVWGLDA